MLPSQALSRLALLASVLCVSACGEPSGGETSATAATRPPSSQPRYGGNMIFAINAEPQTFNGLYIADNASANVVNMMFVGLMQANERFEMVPRIAEGQPEVSADGTVWTVRLRRGVKFHDGVELTADDVAFTYGARLHPDFKGSTAAARSLAKVEAVDDYTVRFTLREPDAGFATRLALPILPSHLLEHVPVAELGDYRAFNVDRPVGAGPFKLVSWTPAQTLVLEAFEDYFEGRPYLDRFTFRFVPSASAGVLLLQTGEIDELLVQISDVSTVESMPDVTLHSRLMPGYAYLGWNLRNPLFEDRRVRQALTLAIDRQEVVDTLLGGRARVAHAPVSPVIGWAYTDDVPLFGYDPDRARALLAEAGWRPGSDGVLMKDGRRFSFRLLTSQGFAVATDLAVIVQQYLHAVGIELQPEQLEFGAYVRRLTLPTRDFEAYMGLWVLPLDPDPARLWHSREIAQGDNDLGFSNARVDELAERNLRILDRGERAAVLHEIWRIIAEEQPATFLYHREEFIGLKSDVRGFINNPNFVTYDAHKYWLDR